MPDDAPAPIKKKAGGILPWPRVLHDRLVELGVEAVLRGRKTDAGKLSLEAFA